MTSRRLLLTYEVESDPICAFLKDTTVQIAEDIFLKILFKHKIQKNRVYNNYHHHQHAGVSIPT